MPSQKQVGVRGKIVDAQSREVIANVLKFMKKEAMQGVSIPLTHFKQRVLEATGVSDKVYREILKDMVRIESGELARFRAPSQKHRRPKLIEAGEVESYSESETDSETEYE